MRNQIEKTDLVNKVFNWARRNKILASVIIFSIIVISSGALFTNLDNIFTLCNKYFAKEIPSPEKIAYYRKRAEWLNDYGGDRRSYEILLSWKKKIKTPEVNELLLTEIERLESVYSLDIMILTIENHHSICKFITKPGINPCSEGFEPPIGYDAKNVFQHLNRPLWTERARAACLLRNIDRSPNKDEVNKEELCDKLVKLMEKESENSLFVSKMAFETYKILTGFRTTGVFDFDKAIEDWKQRKSNLYSVSDK